MKELFVRTEMLFGEEAMKKFASSRVAVFGIGGVGGHAAEALVRSGIGNIELIDADTVCQSNINRQLFATTKNIGRLKTEAAKERLLEINPEINITVKSIFYLPENADEFDFTQYDYIIDAVDTVAAKLSLAQKAQLAGTPIISSMGAGNKLDPTLFEVADIYKTSVCPLAKVMRTECRKRGIKKLKCVYSKEIPMKPKEVFSEEKSTRRQTPGSVAFVPSVAGLIIAGEVLKDLAKQ
ncbi:MAG TPA: tRNA threonylcarbamoyladenosine dehydratase [Ruminococcaceae bacterium]|nr:tRNA threonylcarbamoyladenosine dehydratase [Oscillospiraceae bacterium]